MICNLMFNSNKSVNHFARILNYITTISYIENVMIIVIIIYLLKICLILHM